MSCNDLARSFVAKSIVSAICCGTMVNKADGYGVTMFMFPFATAQAVGCPCSVSSWSCESFQRVYVGASRGDRKSERLWIRFTLEDV